MPPPGFQALILCGPGVSLNTFTSNPKDFPKALVPIANRPMVWYPLDWCYRMGITNIILVTPPESEAALDAALSQNPHLTSLPAPKPDILAPKDLTQTTGTGEIFRLPEVQKAITGDFVVLPCDLICELDGNTLVEEWMVENAGLGGATGGVTDSGPIPKGNGGEKIGRRGGLGVWYQTRDDLHVKGEETDFIATAPLPAPIVPAPPDSLRRHLAKLVLAIPSDTLKDITDEKKCFPVRHSLLKHHSRVKMLSTHRDAHIYFFPYWALEYMARNETFSSLSEDVVGWWAKAGWQEGLGDKLSLRPILTDADADADANEDDSSSGNGGGAHSPNGSQRGHHHHHGDAASDTLLDDDPSVAELSTTWRDPEPLPSRSALEASTNPTATAKLASRVTDPRSRTPNTPLLTLSSAAAAATKPRPLPIPPILSYVHPSTPTAPLIRRVDNVPLLLNLNLRLAKLPSIADAGGPNGASPFAHPAKISHPDLIPRRCRVEAENSLLAENVQVAEKANVKESVVGAGCRIGEGARLFRTVLMEGVVVGDHVQLMGCVVGRRCRIEGGKVGGPGGGGEKTVLRDCEIQDGQVVAWGTEAKDEKFMRFEGLSDDDEGDEDEDGEGGFDMGGDGAGDEIGFGDD